MKLHVIPVPKGMTPEEAWAEISVMGCLVEYRWWHRFTSCRWALIEVDE